MTYDKPLKPPFGRIGNKFKLRYKIVKLIPQHKIYVEPFAGSGAIFFNKEKADINVLNDLNKDVIKRFRMVRNAPSDLSTYKQDLNTISKLKKFYTNHSNSKQDKLLMEHIRISNGFNGKTADKVSQIYKPHNPFTFLMHIREYKSLLKGVKLSSKDYEDVIHTWDSHETFFFIDPPYENTNAYFDYAESSEFDFVRLYDTLHKIKGLFMLTINDSQYIRKLFKDYYIKKINVHQYWGNAIGEKNEPRKELIIMNYKL